FSSRAGRGRGGGVFFRCGGPGAAPQGGAAAAGNVKYQQLCASCHGATGKGDGPAAKVLNPKPRNHTDAEYMKTISDEYIAKITKLGGVAVGKSPLMPPWGGVLSDADVQNLVAFMRSLAK
ncbi:MAG: cytochrome c, partial [Nitrospinae bacterium]|nr:cytochrome c [Nitrospinota bacterium]